MRFTTTLATLPLAALLATTALPNAAEACGCFAPPDPSVPIVQAGERILFSHDDGKVVAHIQIQYQGEASDFGWILPVPAVPEMSLGTEELFTFLTSTTQPKYRLITQPGGSCDFGGGGGRNALAGAAPESAPDADDGAGPLVVEDSIGPYDFAVLRGNNRDEMFEWLQENRYFIPAGTEDVVGPYIHDDGYFLALKLRSGNDAGDLQPVVLRYDSDLPMIPIVLTSVAANPDMGIQVWMLGDERAIPRNYFHTVINEALIDWFNAGANYNEVIIQATNEAEGGHAFVTEYAGTSSIMQNTLDSPGRYGNQEDLAAATHATHVSRFLNQHRFNWTPALTNTLQKYIPMPDAVLELFPWMTPAEFYSSLESYLMWLPDEQPGIFDDIDFENIDFPALADEVFQRIVIPNREASALFDDWTYLTRLYTTLSPDEMNRDPVFSYNADLPDYSNIHEATFTTYCDRRDNELLGELQLGDGQRLFVDSNGGGAWDDPALPGSSRIEILGEEGAPQIVVDNRSFIAAKINTENTRLEVLLPSAERNSGGCAAATPASPFAGVLLLVFALRRRRSA